MTRSASLSIVDRLMEDPLNDGRLTGSRGNQHREELCNSIRRELVALLNTRCSMRFNSTAFPELDKSLLSYGINEIVFLTLPKKEAVQELLSELTIRIEANEPRLSEVRIALIRGSNEEDRQIELLIEGDLRINGTVTSVKFETCLDPEAQHFTIGGNNER
ncbi:MAG: type VI secretion system baseplate subunit TssE [Brucella intermedia]